MKIFYTSYALYRFPRFAGGGFRKFTGWSKPQIRLYRTQDLVPGQIVEHRGKMVKLMECSRKMLIFQVTNGRNGTDGIDDEILTVVPNKPVKTGSDDAMNDARCDTYTAYWTSQKRWFLYYVRVNFIRWIDKSWHKLKNLPTHFTRRYIKHVLDYRYKQLKITLEDLLPHK